MEETATKVDSVKASLDQLSRDVGVQTKRVAEKGGEISQKLESLDAVANEAQTRGETTKLVQKSCPGDLKRCKKH
jgi:hypothetical protein